MSHVTKTETGIDLNKIKYPKVKKFLDVFGLHSDSGFSQFKADCYTPEDDQAFHLHYEEFTIEKNIELVWNTYKSISPKEAWQGDMVRFGLLYCRQTKNITYADSAYAGMNPGQVLILNLRFLFGLFNLAVAHEVMEVNDSEKSMKLCYMQGGASKGSQWITLHSTPEGFTLIKHKTRYSSGSAFRDTKLYPMFHTKAIREFHGNVKRLLSA